MDNRFKALEARVAKLEEVLVLQAGIAHKLPAVIRRTKKQYGKHKGWGEFDDLPQPDPGQ